MKSEHRHELETNELSAGLAKSIEKLKPLSGQILTVVGVLLAIYAGVSIWESQLDQKEAAAWEAYALATDSKDPEMKSLQRVANDEQYAGTKMSEWAYVAWADRQVLRAMQYYFVDREETLDLLRNVEGIYQGFASDASDPQVMNRARFGLARVYELQNKPDKARKQYLAVRGNLRAQAEERAEQLDSEKVREVCDWLATAQLPKRDQTGGQGATGTRPSFDTTVPQAKRSTDSISAESLEELLNDFESSATDENRYGEQDGAFKTDGTAEGEAADSTDTEASADDDAAE